MMKPRGLFHPEKEGRRTVPAGQIAAIRSFADCNDGQRAGERADRHDGSFPNSKQASFALCPFDCVASALAPVAPDAKQLKVCGIVRSASDHWLNVIDFELFLCATCRATMVLFDAKRRYILGRVRASIFGFLRSAIGGINRVIESPVLDVRRFPGIKSRLGLFRIFLFPSLHLRAMSSGISRPPSPRSGGFISRPRLVPLLATLDRALNANAIRNESLVMPVLARNASRVVALASRAGCYAVRMLGALGRTFKRVNDGARGTNAGARISLGHVSVPARLAGKVESLASRAGGFSLWNSAHRPSGVSDMFIAHSA
jgi:hypothetical protein